MLAKNDSGKKMVGGGTIFLCEMRYCLAFI